MLGVGVERDAGDIEEGSFLGNVSGVRHNAFCMVDEVTEMQITLRRQDVQIRRGDVQRFDGFLHIRVQGRNDGHAFGFLNQCLYQRFENMFLGQQVVPVEGQQQVTALFQPYGGEPYRLQQTVTVVADGIYSIYCAT